MNSVINFFKWCLSYFNHKFKKTEQNCPCYDKEGNFIGWFSRSVAAALFVFADDSDGKRYVLASQRGKGTPDPEFVGAWNGVCGYVDFNETVQGAVKRELKEETGVVLPDNYPIKLFRIDDDPTKDKRQNITLEYYVVLPDTKDVYEKMFSHDGNEQDEVGEIRFIPLDELDNYRWAFGHDNLIRMCRLEQIKKETI